MGKSLTRVLKQGVSRKTTAMTFHVSRETSSAATLRSNDGNLERMYELESSVVRKPDASGTVWITLPITGTPLTGGGGGTGGGGC